MKAAFAYLVATGLAGVLAAQTPKPTPAATPGTGDARPRTLGFGQTAAPLPQTTAGPSRITNAQRDSLAAVASKIKLRKLTAEDLKRIKNGEASTPPAAPDKPGETSDRQKQREEALAEFNATVEPLFDQGQQVEGECRACRYSCSGTTEGSALTTDTNGNWVVISTSVDNSTTPQCRNCRALCFERRMRLADQFNAARENAISKGVYRHELDTGHLVFGNVKD